MKYFITFTEEGIFNPDYFDYAGGRIEVHHPKKQWAIEEIRFFCPLEKFRPLRKKWDFKEITKKELDELRTLVQNEYREEVTVDRSYR